MMWLISQEPISHGQTVIKKLSRFICNPIFNIKCLIVSHPFITISKWNSDSQLSPKLIEKHLKIDKFLHCECQF